jgi:hypothetical protein
MKALASEMITLFRRDARKWIDSEVKTVRRCEKVRV